MLREGDWYGRQLVPASVVQDVRRGGDLAKFAKGAPWASGYPQHAVGFPHELDAFEGRGIHGQRLHVAPNAEMVVARFASHPLAGANGFEPMTGPQCWRSGGCSEHRLD